MQDSEFDPFAQFSQAMEKRPEPKPYIPQVDSKSKWERVDEELGSPPSRSDEKRRPRLVWWIAGFYLLGFISTLLSFAAWLKDWIRLPPDDLAFFSELGPVSLLFTLILASVNLYAIIRLFQLRAEAARLLLFTFIAHLINTLWLALTTSWLQVMTNRTSGLVGYLFGVFINAWVVQYAYKLKEKGTLS